LRKSRKAPREQTREPPTTDNANVYKLHRSTRNAKRVEMIPRNTAQETYIDHLFNDDKRIVFAIGPAGTGKSYLGVLRAIKALKDKEVEKLIIVRPAVGAEGENHGFLPGDLNQKLGPWLQPLIDVFEEYYNKVDFQKMVEDGVIEFASLMYLRGRSFKNSIVILDEAQNSLPSQMKLLLTRIGENTRAFVTGDLDQTDHRKQINGLSDFIERLRKSNSDMIGVAEFQHKHIERDPIVAEVLKIYGE
jgi:phosphate starvation-inducible PhoH-like protein